jgi:hypothetical protein
MFVQVVAGLGAQVRVVDPADARVQAGGLTVLCGDTVGVLIASKNVSRECLSGELDGLEKIKEAGAFDQAPTQFPAEPMTAQPIRATLKGSALISESVPMAEFALRTARMK